MSNYFYIVSLNEKGEIITSNAMSEKEAKHYRDCLETLHGLYTHKFVSEEELNKIKKGFLDKPLPRKKY